VFEFKYYSVSIVLTSEITEGMKIVINFFVLVILKDFNSEVEAKIAYGT